VAHGPWSPVSAAHGARNAPRILRARSYMTGDRGLKALPYVFVLLCMGGIGRLKDPLRD
jgi:hypothetical protein